MPAAPFTAPVSRHLAVADLARSVAFYRDVLGFSLATDAPVAGPDEDTPLVRGSARIVLRQGDAAFDSTFARIGRGEAIVHLPVEDVGATRQELLARGAIVSPVCAVNMLKLHVCTTTDPDGHQLWFTTSYHHDTPPRPAPMVEQIMPTFSCASVPTAVEHYTAALGFSVNYAQPDFAVLDREQARILLASRADAMPGPGACYLYVRDADGLHAELAARGARVEGEPVSQPWGLREFFVRDLDGNRLGFGQPFE